MPGALENKHLEIKIVRTASVVRLSYFNVFEMEL